MVKRNKTRGNKTIRNKTRRNKTIIKGGAWKVKKTKIDIKFDACEKKYCKDLTKDKKLYEKEETKKCPKSLSDMEFYECSKMYDTSNYKKMFDKNTECTKQYCSKERADRAEKWFKEKYTKGFYCTTKYNGITECRDFTLQQYAELRDLLYTKYPATKQYKAEISKLMIQGGITKTHVKIYYIMLTKKQ